MKDKFWKFYSEAWHANEELREQLYRAIRERDEERILRQSAEKRLVEAHMDKKIEYGSLESKST